MYSNLIFNPEALNLASLDMGTRGAEISENELVQKTRNYGRGLPAIGLRMTTMRHAWRRHPHQP